MVLAADATLELSLVPCDGQELASISCRALEVHSIYLSFTPFLWLY